MDHVVDVWKSCKPIQLQLVISLGNFKAARLYKNVCVCVCCFPLGILAELHYYGTEAVITCVELARARCDFIWYAWLGTWLMARNLFSITRIHNLTKNYGHQILFPHSNNSCVETFHLPILIVLNSENGKIAIHKGRSFLKFYDKWME